MVSARVFALLSTMFLVVGALLVGDAIHVSLVTGEFAVTHWWVFGRFLLGSVFIALGYRFRTPTSEYVDMPSGEPTREQTDEDGEPAEGATGDFDPEMSPLGDDGLEHLDSDDRSAGERPTDDQSEADQFPDAQSPDERDDTDES
ncbi:hypothetical protein [Halorussus halophilus]|uniref:hypothetical protein n=1 Tax=Halorussus halophilus TaxID=2650975 RepID=UPI0013011F60|nr:hypothetical protein [Halorussus halophilus]